MVLKSLLSNLALPRSFLFRRKPMWNRRSMRNCLVATLIACSAALMAHLALAGKTSNTLGPVTISPVPADFVNHFADLGGVLDTTTGLIWGYDSYSMGGFGVTLDG